MSDTLRSAAQQALETLEEHGLPYLHHEHLYSKAITALRAALAQPAASGEPAGMPPAPKACLSATPSAGRPDDACPEEWCSVLGQCRIGYKWGPAPAPAEDMAAAVAEPVATTGWRMPGAQIRARSAPEAAPPQREPYDQTALGLCNACGWKAVGPDGCLNCAPQREPQWVPVAERLPPSGQTVLACYTNRAGRLRRIRAEWIAAKSVESSSEHSDIGVYDEDTDTFYDPEGWYERIDNWGDYSAVMVCEGEPTHWMPLPPAPKSA